MNTNLTRLVGGYAALLDVPVESFTSSGYTFEVTTRRDAPEWANWVHPIWFFRMGSALICSVSPQFAEEADAILGGNIHADLLDDALIATAEQTVPTIEWVRTELFYYPNTPPPRCDHLFRIGRVLPGQPGAAKRLRNFDGGVYAIRGEQGEIVSNALVKDKGILQEIAVGTAPTHRRQGMGQAVVAHAITQILAAGKVPTYWPDSLHNAGSYALARGVGLVKVADMLFCAYDEPGWAGFPVDS